MKHPRLHNFLSNITSNQKGFTLIELIIAVAITALITGGAASAIFQVFNINTLNSDHMTAIRQVQNAGFWISQDSQQAQIVVTVDDPDTPDTIEILILSWTNWDGVSHEVTYTIVSNELIRSISVGGGTATASVVARFIDVANTSATWDGSVLTLTVTAEVGGAIEERTYEVLPRPNDQ